MATIAYIDHSYHRKTLSTNFLPEILRKHGHIVDYFWDESWIGGDHVAWHNVQAYDIVIMFQAFSPIGENYYSKLHPNVIFIPMLDQFGIWQGPLFNLTQFWEPFQGSKVLNFSNALHSLTTGFGIKSHLIKYYQPAIESPKTPKSGLHGFFWLRRQEQIPWNTIRQLIANTTFDSFHIHLASDPGTPEPVLPLPDEIIKHNITTSSWFEDKGEFNAILDRANVFFAPRMEEGIGQAFLEALSRGQCVVAPNTGTMNEYILHGVNGFLYNHTNPTPIDFTNISNINQQAILGVQVGREQWQLSEDELVKFVTTDSEIFYHNKYQHQYIDYSHNHRCQTPPPASHTEVNTHIKQNTTLKKFLKNLFHAGK